MIRRNAALEDDDYAAVLRLMKVSRRSLAAELGVLVHQALQAQGQFGEMKKKRTQLIGKIDAEEKALCRLKKP